MPMRFAGRPRGDAVFRASTTVIPAWTLGTFPAADPAVVENHEQVADLNVPGVEPEPLVSSLRRRTRRRDLPAEGVA